MLTLLLCLHVALAAPPAEAPTNAWATEAMTMKRFMDADVQSGSLSQGDQVEVLIIDGTLARVRKEVVFGWVPVDKLTTDEPAAPAVDFSGDPPDDDPAGAAPPTGDTPVPDYDLGKGPPKL